LTEIIVDAAVAFYRFDDAEWELRPIVTANVPEADSFPTIKPGGGIEWTALKNGQTVEVADSEKTELAGDGNRFVQSEIAVPVGEKCVLVVGHKEPAAFDDWTASLVETLGAATETAITRTNQQQELQEQNQQLRNIEGLNKQIREISQIVVEADTRAELEQLVIDQLANAAQIEFAWIGHVDHHENRISPQTQAGSEQGYLDTVSLALTENENTEPTVQAARSKKPCYCENTTEQLLNTDWRTESIEREFKSVLSIPLVHEGTLYGIVSMYAKAENGFSESMRSVLEELGELLADAVVSKVQKDALHADETVELSFDIQSQACIVDQLVAATDCSIKLDGIVPQSGETTLLFTRVADGTAEQVVTHAEQISHVERSRLITSNEDPLVELQVSGSFIGTKIANSKYVLVDLQATTEQTSVTIEVPSGADTREAIALLESEFENVQLRSKQHTNRLSDSETPLPEDLLQTLTTRQREVIEIAYRVGYFDSPRRASGGEIAEMFGFSSTAFHQHIRKAQSKLFEQLLYTAENSLPAVQPNENS
jgi:predicted DNA binding protein/putative methionine-R-sulfoxide reductase with GAF domain